MNKEITDHLVGHSLGVLSGLFRSFFQLDMRSELLGTYKQYEFHLDLASHITLYSREKNWGGMLLLDFRNADVQALCSHLTGVQIESLEEISDYLAEFSNQITGNLSSRLRKADISVSISLPNIVLTPRGNIQLHTLNKDDFRLYRLQAGEMVFYFTICCYDLIQFQD